MDELETPLPHVTTVAAIPGHDKTGAPAGEFNSHITDPEYRRLAGLPPMTPVSHTAPAPAAAGVSDGEIDHASRVADAIPLAGPEPPQSPVSDTGFVYEAGFVGPGQDPYKIAETTKPPPSGKPRAVFVPGVAPGEPVTG